MDKMENRGPDVRFPPPLTFILSAVFAVGIDWLLPWSVIGFRAENVDILSQSAWWGIGFGVILLLIAALLMLASLISFKRHQTNVVPWKPASHLIVTGIYKYSRNPIYVAFFVAQCGLAFLYDSVWIIFTACGALWLIYLTVVKKEEAYLIAQFGAHYLYYKDRVRRWL